ncbi:MAG: hypothetical protein JW740_01965 [Candidatus Zambryskibacteria bacterium]|nr:hypothetical protein [Candidatus Zambryskibacteria bacterium]
MAVRTHIDFHFGDSFRHPRCGAKNSFKNFLKEFFILKIKLIFFNFFFTLSTFFRKKTFTKKFFRAIIILTRSIVQKKFCAARLKIIFIRHLAGHDKMAKKKKAAKKKKTTKKRKATKKKRA